MAKSDENMDLLNESDERMMPLTSSEFTGESPAPLAGETRRKRISGGTLLLIGVVILAAGGLFSMRKLATASASGIINRDVDKLIKELVDGLDRTGGRPGESLPVLVGTEDALRPLNVDYDTQRVPLENVQKDPFRIFTEERVADVPRPVKAPDIEQRRAEFRKQVETAALAFRLKSVMAGSSPLANINGQIVRIGHVIGDDHASIRFKVTRIDNDSVTLLIENPELSMTVDHVLKVNRDF